jgi:N-acetylmuramoyl-L-alanine amidase
MEVKQKFLTKNQYSRPDRELNKVKAIVLHWLASPRGTPRGVFNYFEARKRGKTGYGSAHFCIGLDGETWQYMPMDEMAYHVGSKTYTDYGLSLSDYPNDCTVGVEMSHMDMEGSYTDDTWDRAKKLVVLLLREYGLTPDDITTHKKIVGWKDCPMWFTKFPEEFPRFVREANLLFESYMFETVTAGTLNVRDKPSGKKLFYVNRGDRVRLLSYRDGWIRIKQGERIGWVSSKYLI